MRTRTFQAPAADGRGRGIAGTVCLLALVVLAGCRQDMHQAPRYDPLERSDFFTDQRASRPLVEGVVARGFLREDRLFYTGKDGDRLAEAIPLPVTRDLLERGQERFNIYCAPCHGQTGDGTGMIVQRGFKQPTSFHDGRLRAQPVGYFYDVITNGFGAMQDYAVQVQPKDRWAIAAYLRALQLSRHAPVADLSDEDRAKLEGAAQGGTSSHE